VCARRSKLLPEAPQAPAALISGFADRLRQALEASRKVGSLDRTEAAKKRWAELYGEMAEDDPGGLLGAITARPEAQVLRLAIIFALLDCERAIDVAHLEAAWAVWQYCRDSAAYVFGDAIGDEDADKLWAAIRKAGPDGLDSTAQNAVFSGHLKTKRLTGLRQRLQELGKIVTIEEDTGGRPRTVSYAADLLCDPQ